MKSKALYIAILTFVFTLLGRPSVAYAQSFVCNSSCDVDADCGSGYRCYVGVCRASACPASQNCSCANASASTSATPRATTRPTPSASPSVSPTPTATPRTSPSPTATVSALTTTPKTGFGAWTVAGLSLAVFAGGLALSTYQGTIAKFGTTPAEMASRRRSRRSA